MPAKQLTTGYVEWTGKDTPFASVQEKRRLHEVPFVILDAAIIPTRYGSSAMFLVQTCDDTGANVLGDPPVVLAFSDRDSAPSRRKAVEETQIARSEGSWIGPLILHDFETTSGDDPFVSFRNFTREVLPEPTPNGNTKTRKAAKSTNVEVSEAETIDPDDIPF